MAISTATESCTMRTNSSICISWRFAGQHPVTSTEGIALLLLSDVPWAWSKSVGNKSICCLPGHVGTWDWHEDWHGIWQIDKSLGMYRKTLGTISKLFGDIQSCPDKQKKWSNTPKLHAGRLFSCVSPVGHDKRHSKSDFGRNRQLVQTQNISPIPRTRCWRQVHRGWKRRNKLRQ